MVAKVKSLSRHVARTRGLPKLVYHPDFERTAGKSLLQGIEPLLRSGGPPSPADEIRLFQAMHYCAFRARRARGKRVPITVTARRWIKRRDLIRKHLIEINLGLAYEMLRRTRFTNVDEDDLLSEGLRALCDAVEAFDPWRGYRFSTYACNAVYRGFLRLSKLETRRARFISYGFDSRMERGVDENKPSDWDDRIYSERLQRIIAHNLANLTSQERYILARRFPDRSDIKRDTLERLGREMQVSKEHVRQIQVNALEKLRARLTAEPVLC